MSWHHIIPFALLREVWNRLVDRHVGSQIPEARLALRVYLSLVDRRLPEVDQLITRMRAENTSQKRASYNHIEALSVADVHQLSTAAVWPAWNAVEGPQLRSDDPGDRYMDRFTSGLTANELRRMHAIEWLFRDLSNFVNAGSQPGSVALRLLADAASRGRAALVNEEPIRFRPEMWVKGEDGRWRKRRDGEVLASPKSS